MGRAVSGAAYEVSNVLGADFLERVYERALTMEFARRGIDGPITSLVETRHLCMADSYFYLCSFVAQ